jgi:hypothetical protein
MWGKDWWYSLSKLEHHLMVASASIKLGKLLILWLGCNKCKHDADNQSAEGVEQQALFEPRAAAINNNCHHSCHCGQ